MHRKFPKELLVKYDEPANDEPYLMVLNGGLSNQEEDGERIAIYQLVKITSAKITRELR